MRGDKVWLDYLVGLIVAIWSFKAFSMAYQSLNVQDSGTWVLSITYFLQAFCFFSVYLWIRYDQVERK